MQRYLLCMFGLLQVLISNAAVLLDGFDERLADFDPARFLKTISINTLGPVMVLKELLKHVSTTRSTHALTAIHVTYNQLLEQIK